MGASLWIFSLRASLVNSLMLVCKSLFTYCSSNCFRVVGILTFRLTKYFFAILSP